MKSTIERYQCSLVWRDCTEGGQCAAHAPEVFLYIALAMSEATPALELACVRCGKPAKLQCPTCLELKLDQELAAFCSQDCFKVGGWIAAPPCGRTPAHLQTAVPSRSQAGWASHKKNHKPSLDGWHFCTKRGQGRSLQMPPFAWTGELRPERIGPMRQVPAVPSHASILLAPVVYAMLTPHTQIPEHIPRPDYFVGGEAVSEAESRQQHTRECCTGGSLWGHRATAGT